MIVYYNAYMGDARLLKEGARVGIYYSQFKVAEYRLQYCVQLQLECKIACTLVK